MFEIRSDFMRFQRIARFVVLSFSLNLVWEMSQSFLYAPHFSGSLEFIRIHVVAASVDVAFLSFIVWIGCAVSGMRLGNGLIRMAATALVGFTVAVVIERVALAAGMWSYGIYMPLLPFFGVGLAPILQMTVIPAILSRVWFGVERDSASV
ncbi:MAG: hypothetical protein HGA38_04865 [Candidatus Moranbacteria bacterium]|nr:hypothetical protein [Candidatus Moranbacteria bacterium]NTW46078.1 hypothetical protein [Candidatus Moranbacteria bacterium]